MLKLTMKKMLKIREVLLFLIIFNAIFCFDGRFMRFIRIPICFQPFPTICISFRKVAPLIVFNRLLVVYGFLLCVGLIEEGSCLKLLALLIQAFYGKSKK